MEDLSDRDYRALAQFRYALRRFLSFSEGAARDVGLSPAQHQLLLALKGWDGQDPPTVSELAERLLLKVHSATELVQRAEAAGVVEPLEDPEDARRHLVRLTQEGERLLATLSVQHRDELRRFRAEMTELLDELD